ncbi:centrosomal protein 43 isoform X2 [Pocillopora verrucosa]|uniref:centrosomal protein 43 isoform X2 n=1 Tax=Pocillopora verrucosa TaxID=203993 RepID=UPI003342BB07
MSAEEDTELRDMVAQTLESKGVLGKIRAQLRASVFLALEEQEGSESKIQLVNPDLKKFLGTSEGRLVTGLVREFLEYFDLDFSIAVFDPETDFSDKYPGRNNLARELKLNDVDNTSGSPLLAEVIKRLSPVTNGEVKTSPRQSAADSPRSTSPPNSNKGDKDDQGELSSDSASDDSMISSPRPSKIPQRVRDEKSSKSDKNQDSLLEKLNSEKELNSLSDSRRDKSGRRSPDVTIGSDDGDDIFADIPMKTKESEKQGLMKDTGSKSNGGLSSLKGAPSLGSSGLGSLKGAPPLPGMNNNNREPSKSPNWQDLADIDSKISKLGFDIPDDDKNGEAPDFNDDYEDDFHTSDMSIPEDIDEQLSSLNGYFTSDRTVSQASGEDLDFAEDILNF